MPLAKLFKMRWHYPSEYAADLLSGKVAELVRTVVALHWHACRRSLL